MSKKQLVLIFCLFATQQFSFAQNQPDSSLFIDNSRTPLPTLDLNFGFKYAFTDVQLSNEGPSPFRQFGYQLSINQQVANFLNVGFQLYSGTVYGEEQRELTNINFRTSIVSPRIGVEYNFFPLLKPKLDGKQLIRPYVGIGIGAVFFRSKGDLKDQNGRAYQFWSNGNLYVETEGETSITEATELTRDFVYETDLRDENLDGLKKYSQTALSIPLNAGIRFQISKNVGLNLAFAYVMNFTDLIDNISEQSVGIRKGNPGNDNHLFGSVGLSVFLGTTKRGSAFAPPAIVETDDKSDFTINTNKSLDSTTVNFVTEKKPLVKTNDSESKLFYKDASGSDNSVTNTDEGNESKSTNEQLSNFQDSLSQNNSQTVSEIPSAKDISNQPPKESTGFMWADLNKDNWISPNEVLHFIDLLFEGEPVRTVTEIQNLIDYYFDQD